MAGRSGYVTIIGDKLMVHDLEQKINQLHRTPSDMNEHFPTIINYQCQEMGPNLSRLSSWTNFRIQKFLKNPFFGNSANFRQLFRDSPQK